MQYIRIDWQKLLLNLRRHQNLDKVGKHLGVDPRTLNRIARGETIEPKFTTGIKLLNLHFDLEPEKHRQLYQEQK